MTKFATKWFADQAFDLDKINADVAGAGLSGGAGSALAVAYGTGANTACQGNDARLLFGSEYSDADSLGESSTTSNTWQQKLRLTTPSLVGGDYLISWNLLSRCSSTFSGNTEVQVDLNEGTILYHALKELKDSGSDQKIPSSGWDVRTLGSGVQTIDVDYRSDVVGSIVAYIWGVRLEIFRVS